MSAGRGRGGVPLLPTGLWDSLNNNGVNNDSNGTNVDEFIKRKRSESVDIADDRSNQDHDERFRDASDEFGKNPYKNQKGPQMNMKGKDWNCPSCGNLNWSWRTTCNMCNTPKVFQSTGKADAERDGAGGGFNERQERASATTVEIDEEGFDDFGRRVKKINRADKKAKEEAALKRLSEKYKHLLPSDDQSNDPPERNSSKVEESQQQSQKDYRKQDKEEHERRNNREHERRKESNHRDSRDRRDDRRGRERRDREDSRHRDSKSYRDRDHRDRSRSRSRDRRKY